MRLCRKRAVSSALFFTYFYPSSVNSSSFAPLAVSEVAFPSENARRFKATERIVTATYRVRVTVARPYRWSHSSLSISQA